jgi:hypothetical protein
MSRGGHNWRGTGTVEGTRSIDVMELARDGFLSKPRSGSIQWRSKASIKIICDREAVILDYLVKAGGQDWQAVHQRVPISWTPCRFGGERPWFICDVSTTGVHCGRPVGKLYSGGRFFACRHCHHLGYAVQRGDPMDRAHHRLARLHRKLGADYGGADMPPPQKPKWMRWKTYSQIVQQIEAGEDRLEVVFTVGTQRLLARLEKMEHRSRRQRRWAQ